MEDQLTIDELLETYEKIMEKKMDDMEFMARMNGADFKRPQVQTEEVTKDKKQEPGLVQRLKQRKEQEKEKLATSGEKVNFSEGIGYQIIK